MNALLQVLFITIIFTFLGFTISGLKNQVGMMEIFRMKINKHGKELVMEIEDEFNK
jgi:hypothetical protein